jgi:SPP1 gp7 family putative phage head morphogenesis protein
MITPHELQRTKAELNQMEDALLTRYLQYSLVRSGHIERLITEGNSVESIVKMAWKGLREIWEKNLADAMMEAFQRGYARVQRLMSPYLLQEKGYPWSAELTAIIKALAADKVNLEENTTKQQLKEIVMSGIKEGLNVYDIAKNIHEKLGLGMGRAKNIATTEINYAYSLGHWVGALEAGVEKVRIIGALDAFTCEYCQKMNGMVVDIGTIETGYLPPFHFQCRCLIQPLLGKMAGVERNLMIEPRGGWVNKGFGIPGRHKGMQVIIERTLPSLRQQREAELKKLTASICQLPPPYNLSDRGMRRAQEAIEDASQFVSLSQLREANKIVWFGYQGNPFNRPHMAGGYFPVGVSHFMPEARLSRLPFPRYRPAIGIRASDWDAETVGHELAHRLVEDVYSYTVKEELTKLYEEALLKSIPLLDQIFSLEDLMTRWRASVSSDEWHQIQLAYEAVHQAPKEDRMVFASYIYRQMFQFILTDGTNHDLATCERILRPYFPSLYGATTREEFIAEAAGRFAGNFPILPAGSPWVKAAKRLYASLDDLVQAGRFLKEHGIEPPRELWLSENEEMEEMEEKATNMKCKPVKRFILLRGKRKVGEVALGEGCLTYQLEVYIPRLRRKLEAVRESGYFPYFIGGGIEDGIYWDRSASLENIQEATVGLFYLAEAFGLELKEVI